MQATHKNRYDPDLNRTMYSVEQIARSYQGSHQMVWNMPPDDELIHALKLNGHGPDKLDDLKREYVRVARAIGLKD